jgi:predicted Zn-dependent protease
MIQAGIDPAHFGRIMEKLSGFDEQGGDQTRSSDKTTAREEAQKEEDRILDYLSTHPATPERIKQSNHYSELFKKRHLDNAETDLPPGSSGQ